MNKILQKIFFALFVFFSTQTLNIFGMATSTNEDKDKKHDIWIERRTANATDVAIDATVAEVVNACILQSPEASLLSSAGYGIAAWLSGELAETIYKKAYKIITGKTLREALGTTTILGIEIDNQRLLRRIVSITGLCLTLYLTGQ